MIRSDGVHGGLLGRLWSFEVHWGLQGFADVCRGQLRSAEVCNGLLESDGVCWGLLGLSVVWRSLQGSVVVC